MNAIIIAAGSGQRISKDAKDLPKSLLMVNGKPIIVHQIQALKQVGIENIIVITGAHSKKFEIENVRYVEDHCYNEHDILGSLMKAKDFLKNDTLVLYSDIIFESKILRQILDSKGDISIAIDMTWEKMYEGRTEHPKSEAENVQLNKANKIIKIEKNIKNENYDVGEFLGIIKFSPDGSGVFIKQYEELIKTHVGTFHQAPSVLKAYLTDMIQELIDSQIDVEPIIISGKWCEIDTKQDLEKAQRMFS